MPRDALPIDAVLPDLLSKLKQTGAVVLQAPTGAGKTTRVPPALIGPKQLLLLEPRRVAARAAARRMAFEDNTPLGKRFGYHVRFENNSSRETKVLAITPGILLRYLQDDPFLERIGTIVFDEFHERGLESDLALGMVKLLRQTVRPDLQVVVMSATLDVHRIATYLGDCPIAVSEGRSFPVTVRYRTRRLDTHIVDAAAAEVRTLLNETPGDLLVFLPGLGEIRRLEERLTGIDAMILPLHGELPPEQQDRALVKHDRRKIVLATNVAETSVTVDGVTAVIDTGQARQMEFEPAIGMNRLRLAPISKASADQRAGRAGRTQPGVCVRLWDEASHTSRPPETVPEIHRIDLAPAVLQMLALGEDPAKFPWLDPPAVDHVAASIILLERLNAVQNGTLTELGQAMAALPVHPRLARMLLDAPGEVTALAAAILSERDPFDRESDRQFVPTHSDLIDRVEAVQEFRRTGRTQFPIGTLHRSAAKQLLHSHSQLLRQLPKASGDPLRAIYSAFADRLCRRRTANDRRGVMLGGRGVRLAPNSGVIEPDLFVAIDIDAGGAESLVRIASEVQRDWLPKEYLKTTQDLEFESATGRVTARKRTRFHDLIIDDTAGHIADDTEAARILAVHVSLESVQPPEDTAAAQLLVRWNCLREWRPDLELPILELKTLLPELCRGCRSLADVRNADWLSVLRNSLDWKLLQLLDREAPTAIEVPSGRIVELKYEAGRPPVLAAKIQELFGLQETPRVAGRVKVLVHLLAPNGRPAQVTDDLARFWASSYQLVRKDLRGRYPKHDWPEDPSTAIASRGVRRNPG